MNNDLISRKALKKCAIPCEIHNGALTELCVPLYQIDNAPTVKAFTIDEVEEIRQATMEQVRISCKQNERPKGKWNETGYETGALGITYRQTQCSNCGWEHALPMWLNYCPNCGAQMYKDIEDNKNE